MSTMFTPSQYNHGETPPVDLPAWLTPSYPEPAAVPTDTGWVDVAPANSYFTVYDSGPNPRIRRIGSQVFFAGEASPGTGNTAGATTESATNLYATLDTQFRPVANGAYDSHVFVCQGSGFNRWKLRVYDTGAVHFLRYGITGDGNPAPGNWLPFAVSWMV